MRGFIIVLTLMLSGLLLNAGAAAEVLTLTDCIETALKNHPDIVRADQNVNVANSELWNAAGQFLPNIGASGSVSESWGNRIDINGLEFTAWTKRYSLDVSASISAFSGGRKFFNYFSSRANKAYFEYLAEGSRQSLIHSVKTYYFAYLAAQKTLEIREEALKRGEEQLKLAESRFEVGAASKSDVLKARVQFGTDRLNLITADNNVKKAFADLTYVIGVDVNSDVQFSTEYQTDSYEGTEADALKYGLGHHPGFLASEKDMKASKWDVWSAYAQYLPSINVSVSRGYSNPKWSELTDFNDTDASWRVSTSISIPIFEQFSRKVAVSRAKASLNNSRAAFYYARNDLALQIKKAYLDMENAQERLQVAEETVVSAQEDMDLVQEKYNLGAATILELLDAQVSLITAENDKIQAEFDYNLAVATLEKAMGIK